MIVTQLLGGLGNQLFQYSLGRALAHRNGAELCFDVRALQALPSRRYALAPFRIRGRMLTNAERRALRVVHRSLWLLSPSYRLLGLTALPLVREPAFGFDPAVLKAPAACYTEGYWQSPKYFASIENQIREEIDVVEPLAGRNLELADRIRSARAVSLHVRRGDYIENPSTHNYHGVCSPQYYDAAQKLLMDRLGSIELFVFSDDPDWVGQNVRFLAPATVIRHNGPEKDYEDLRLLSLCRHHIIANSTFSWWGAWLSRPAEKLVIAPKRWFQAAKHSTEDLIPPQWIRL